MIQVDVKQNHDLQRIIRQYPKAAIQSLNRAGSSLRTNASAELRKAYTIQKSRLEKDRKGRLIYLRKARKGLDSVALVFSKRRIPLIHFKPKWSKRMPGAAVTLAGQTQVRRHTFIQTMISGHKGVFARKGPAREMIRGKYIGRKRQPIVEQAGPSPSEMIQTSNLQEPLLHKAIELFKTELYRRVESLKRGVGG